MDSPRVIFLTGFTGNLGREFARELLQENGTALILLIRPSKKLSAFERAEKILRDYGLENCLKSRVRVLEGDVTEKNLGLSREIRNELRLQVTELYHIAALTALNGSQAECEKVNVGGTQKVLELAWDLYENGKLKRFYYFSTAFVAGSMQTYISKEDELPVHPAHANYYESSKYQAETKIRQVMRKGLPVTIFRPSIVVGDSKTGAVSDFNVIYPFFKMFGHGMLSILPTRPENSFNIVPIDFVIRSAAVIARQKDSVGKTFHLVTKNPPTIQTLLRLKEDEYPNMPPVEIVSPDQFKKEGLHESQRFVYDALAPYFGYLNEHLSFDTANTDQALAGTGIEFPDTGYDFLKTICRYAVDVGYLLVE